MGHTDTGTDRHRYRQKKVQTDTGTDRHRYKQTQVQTDTGTNRHRYRQTQVQTDTGTDRLLYSPQLQFVLSHLQGLGPSQDGIILSHILILMQETHSPDPAPSLYYKGIPHIPQYDSIISELGETASP